MTVMPAQTHVTDGPLRPRPVDRRTVVRGLGLAAGAGLALGPGGVPLARAQAQEPVDVPAPPNVVVISIDDLAWKELGCYGNTFNETPHIDRLAAQGLRFTDAYAAASICSPTRASLMTGRYPANIGITDYLREMPAPSQNFLSPEIPTISSVVGDHGYVSGLVGKWHLTEVYGGEYRDKPGSPYAHGFDEVRVSETRYIGGGDYNYPYSFMPEVTGAAGEYLTDRLAQEAVDFIETHRDQPFFMHLSNFSVHTSLSAKPDLLAKYQAKPGAGQGGNNAALAAMLESIDEQVGAVVASLEALELAGNTLVLVVSDNGGDPAVTTNAPLRGHKSDLYEGGIRVAMIASWPDVVEAGGVSDVPVSTIDVFPTILDIGGMTPPSAEIDGVSLAPLLRGEGPLDRDALYWVYPHFHFLGATPQAAVRAGQYKLVQDLRDGQVELFDLEADLGETTDLATRLPAVATDLRARLEDHVEQSGILARPPTADDYTEVELAEEFLTDLSAYTVLTRPSGQAAALVVDGGALGLSGTTETMTICRSEVAPGEGPVAVTVDVRSFAESTGTQDTLFVGLVKDADNFVMIWHNNARGRTGWDAFVGGAAVSRAGAEPLASLENEVDLTAPGARLSFAVDGRTFTAYCDPGTGEWEFLFRVDIGEALDLGDPVVRSEYRYGFGARVNAGTMLLERVEARRRVDLPPAVPTLSLGKDRLGADETTVEVGVSADGVAVSGGTVTLREDGATLGAAPVDTGVATVVLARPLAPGVHRLLASYSGTDDVAAAEAPLVLQVDRRPRVGSRVVARPRKRVVKVGRRVRLDVRVQADRTTPTGAVVVMRHGRVVARGRLGRRGTVSLAWTARRPLGRQTFQVRYLGTPEVAPSATTVTVQVMRSRRARR